MGLYEQVAYYSSIVSGVLLLVSETLPYIKSVDSNGIFELLMQKVKKRRNESYEEIPEIALQMEPQTSDVGIQYNDDIRNKLLQDRIEKLSKHIYDLKECLEKLK